MESRKIKQIIKNLFVRVKFYKSGAEKVDGNQLVFFVKEGYPQAHPGLVDRFKAIVGLYYIAKCNGFDFRLVYDTPFSLNKYLQPNQYDWSRTDSVNKKWKNVKLMEYGGFKEIPQLSKEIPQYHCYYYEGLNILKMAKVENWTKLWGNLYRELFKPSDYLNGLLKANIPEENYVAIHVRFVNALENFEKGYESNLSEAQKQQLIERCLGKIGEIKDKEQKEVYIFSDSTRFLTEVRKKDYRTLPIENIGHISFQNDSSVHDKTFIDFYAMSMGDKVYSIQGEHVYTSVFSQFAAIVGNVDYEIVKL